MEEIKYICDCGKKIDNVYNPPDNFEYAGCDEEDNPTFKCKDCGVYIYG